MPVNRLIAALVFTAVLGLPSVAMASIQVQTSRVNVTISDNGDVWVNTPRGRVRASRYYRRPDYYRTSSGDCGTHRVYQSRSQGRRVYSRSSTSTTIC